MPKILNMKSININGQLRTEFGKKFTRQLRSQNLVPGVVYGGEQGLNFSVPEKELKNLVYTSEFQLVVLHLENKTYQCIIKDLQFDKVSDQLIHIDLLELTESKKVKATLPLKFVGNAAGVKVGGKLVIKMKSLKIKTLPQYLKEHIEVDITHLELNQNIRVEDIKEPNFEILNSPRIPIVSITLTRQLKQEEASASSAASANTNTAASQAKPEAKKEVKK